MSASELAPTTKQMTFDDVAELVTDDDGRYDCREVYSNFEFESEDGDTAPYRCGSWNCYCCGYRMRMNLVEEIERVCSERPEMRRLVTLTLDPEMAPDDPDAQHKYLTERLNALRTELTDRYGDISYIWVREEGEKTDRAHPHLHIIIDRYIDQSALSAMWERVGGGEIVGIEYISGVENAAHYVGKYLTKNAMSNLPDGINRYGSSQDITLDVRGNKQDDDDDGRDWELKMDDWQIVTSDGDPLRRPVTKVDFAQQKDWGGPVPPD